MQKRSANRAAWAISTILAAGVLAGLAATKNVDGLSLTMPHKITGYAHCATVSETSRMLGVVSAIRAGK